MSGSQTPTGNADAPEHPGRNAFRFAVLASSVALMALAGCQTARTMAPPAPPAVHLPATPAAAPPKAEVTLLIESDPAGATIVVDGRPVGRAPVRVAVPATAQGFFCDYVEIRARFVAGNSVPESRTATEEFTPREKVPTVLRCTPGGAQRTM